MGGSNLAVLSKSITLVVERDATVPVTGLRVAGAELEGGQAVAHVRVAAGTPVTIALP
jgi:hypothetical protein